MATLHIETIADCADWSKTVEPVLPQLYALPQTLLSIIQRQPNAPSLVELYTAANPLITGFAISIIFGAIFLIVAEANKNYSQVDRCWSILPTFYIGHYNIWARLNGFPHQRLDAVLLWAVVWSTRLTFNYWRRGGYQVGSEDYRWEIIRKNIPAWAFQILNVTFIAFIQSVLLFSLSAPIYPVLLATKLQPELEAGDYFLVVTEVALVFSEWISDGQQWHYHQAKDAYKKTGKPDPSYGYTQVQLDRGFNTTGLWAYSRHPNFTAEQTIWFTFYQWSCYSTHTLYNWTVAGPAFLILLFQGSTWITELITSNKYEEYGQYQTEVGMFVPKKLTPYEGLKPGQTPPPAMPKIIRTSEIAKKIQKKAQ